MGTYTWVHTTTVLPSPTAVMPAPGTSTVDCPADAACQLHQLLLIIAEDRSLMLLVLLPCAGTILIHLLILIALVRLIHGSILIPSLLQLTVMPAPGSSTVACPADAAAANATSC